MSVECAQISGDLECSNSSSSTGNQADIINEDEE